MHKSANLHTVWALSRNRTNNPEILHEIIILYTFFFLFFHILYLHLYKLLLKNDNLDIKELNFLLNYW